MAAALVLGLVAAVLLIWRRERLSAHSAMRGPLSAGLTLRGSGSIPSGSLNLTLELDGKGEPLLLGQGSSAKVDLLCRICLYAWPQHHSLTCMMPHHPGLGMKLVQVCLAIITDCRPVPICVGACSETACS